MAKVRKINQVFQNLIFVDWYSKVLKSNAIPT